MKATILTLALLATLACFPALAWALPPACPRGTVAPTMTTDPDQIVRETFHVAGDAPDPAGTGLRGVAPGYRLNQNVLGRPLCHYTFGPGGDMIVELDVYALPGEPMYVHLLCPHCRVRGQTNALRITADQKAMSYEPQAFAPTFPTWTDAQMAEVFPHGTGGVISIARFKCTWELDGSQAVNRGVELTSNLCDFDVVIERNVVRRWTQTARRGAGDLATTWNPRKPHP